MEHVGEQVSEKLLPRVSCPAQYVGLEINARCPDVRGAELTVALAFPDAYRIGISHLGLRVLYHVLNDMPGVAADRVYCPRPDAEAVMRSEGVPLFGWESRCAVRDFDVLGFSLAYELCVTNVLTMLDLAGIPLRAAERHERDPIVVAGDALADSPEPMAAFVDLFIPGDGEGPIAALAELFRGMKANGAPRQERTLEAARTIPSVYAPAFYRPRYDQAGRFAALEVIQKGVPEAVRRASLGSLSESPAITAPLMPLAEAEHDRVTIEIMRGCPNACRFCQAGATRLPVRRRSVDQVVEIARAAVAATGYRQIALLSLSVSDYPDLEVLIDRLNAEFAERRVSISLPSLRVDSRLRRLPGLTGAVRKGSLTIAAEAGSERMRRAIRKDIAEEDMIAGVRSAYEAGWRRVKVYFIAGLPGERDADIEAIFELCGRLSDARKDVDGQRGAISAGISWFVPKPHTPMQWCPMRRPDYLVAVRRRLRDLGRRSPVSFRFHHVEQSVLEAVIARGDRRVGAAIEAAWLNGARMDAWYEHFDCDKWTAAFDEAGIDPAEYAHREIPVDSPLPWSHIVCPRGSRFLLAEHRRMLDALDD